MIQVLDPQEWIIQIKSVRYKRGKVVSICDNLGQILKSETLQVFLQQNPQRDSGSARAKKVLEVFENDTKENSQENVPRKVRFQKTWVGGLAFVVHPPPSFVGGLYNKEKTFQSCKRKVSFAEDLIN